MIQNHILACTYYTHALLDLNAPVLRQISRALPAFVEVVLPAALSVLAFHWTEKEIIK